ncbi:MAG: polysaccharide biosynthesis protein, partial [Nitrosomonadaceae bacterium]|nr:polysaccharide biosynthesis protein [Nitrosomonadaceae bacterium]
MKFSINERAVLAFSHDVFMVGVAWVVAYLLFVPTGGLPSDSQVLLTVLAVALPVQAAVATIFGMYQGLWRYASLQDLRRIVFAALLSTGVIPILHLMGRFDTVVPRSTLLMMPLVMASLMASSRFGYRMLREWLRARETSHKGEPVIVIGAGDSGVSLLRELSRSARWRAV